MHQCMSKSGKGPLLQRLVTFFWFQNTHYVSLKMTSDPLQRHFGKPFRIAKLLDCRKCLHLCLICHSAGNLNTSWRLIGPTAIAWPLCGLFSSPSVSSPSSTPPSTSGSAQGERDLSLGQEARWCELGPGHRATQKLAYHVGGVWAKVHILTYTLCMPTRDPECFSLTLILDTAALLTTELEDTWLKASLTGLLCNTGSIVVSLFF